MADVVITMESDFAKLLRDQEKTIKKQQKQIDLLRKTVGESKKLGNQFAKTGQQGKGAFSQVGVQLLKTVGTMVSLSSAVRVVGGTFRFMEEEAQAAVNTVKQLEDVRRRFAQLGDQERLRARADELAISGPLTREQAGKLVFASVSEGFEDSVKQLARASIVIDPAASATLAGQVPGLFPRAGLTAMQGVNAGLLAARQSRLNVEQLSRALPKAAGGVELAGGTPAEAFVTAAVLAKAFESGDVAGRRIKAFGVKLALDERLKGRGIVGGVEALQAFSEKDRKEFLGENIEINEAFIRLSQNLKEIVIRIKEVEQALATSGTPRSVLNVAIAETLAVPGERERLQAKREGVIEDIAAEKRFATSEFEREAAASRARTRLIEDPRTTGVERFFAARFAQAARIARVSPANVEFASRLGQIVADPGVALRIRIDALIDALGVTASINTNAALKQLAAANMRNAEQQPAFAPRQRQQAAVPQE